MAASHVAKWNGSNWSALGSGTNDIVNALEAYDDGSGPALFAGGDFTIAGSVTANHVAKWSGSSWAALAGGVDSGVSALAVYDDGGGAALYVGGAFSTAGGVTANHVAKWDGSGWAALGSGVSFGGPTPMPCTTTAADRRSTPEETSRTPAV